MQQQGPAVTRHESGLATQELVAGAKVTRWERAYDLPRMCPKSHQPEPGSRIVVNYDPAGAVLEVMALDRRMRQLVQEHVGGFQGGEGLAPVRDMEGAVATLARGAANALGVPVSVRAELIVFGHAMNVEACAEPA